MKGTSRITTSDPHDPRTSQDLSDLAASSASAATGSGHGAGRGDGYQNGQGDQHGENASGTMTPPPPSAEDLRHADASRHNDSETNETGETAERTRATKASGTSGKSEAPDADKTSDAPSVTKTAEQPAVDFDGPARPDDPAAGAPCEAQPLYLYSTTVSDVGTVRSNNQDSSFAGERLIAICDGMGGHAGGDTASTIAIRSLSHIEQNDPSADVASVASMMETSVMAAHDAIVGKAKRERSLAGMGTTVTAVSLVAGHWVVTHIGDSRAYLLRDGKLRRMTQDHSYVQHLIDTGRITEAEARNHPQRNVVMRVLGDFDIDPHPDIAVIKAEPTDRWLLCSDGLCGVLEDTTIEDVLATVSDSEECAQRLVAMSLKAGSTDNVTAVVADAILALSATGFDVPHQTPLIGGAASSNLEAIADIVKVPVASAPALRLGKQSPALRAAALSHGPAASSPAASGADPDADAGDLGDDSAGTADTEANTAAQTDAASVSPSQPGISEAAAEVAAAPTEPVHVAKPAAVRDENDTKANMDTGEIPVVKKKDGRLSADPNDPEVARVIRKKRLRAKQKSRKRHSHWRLAIIIAAVVVVVAVLGGGAGAYRWSQTKYYLGKSQGKVAIYQGVNTNFFGARLSHEIETTDISSSQLPQSWDDALDQGITVDSLDDAHSHVRMIRKEARNLKTSKGKSAPLPWTADARAKDDGNSDAKTAPKDQPAGQSKSSKPDSQSDQGKAGDSGTSADSGNATFGADPKAASQ